MAKWSKVKLRRILIGSLSGPNTDVALPNVTTDRSQAISEPVALCLSQDESTSPPFVWKGVFFRMERLVLTQRQKASQKWPIDCIEPFSVA